MKTKSLLERLSERHPHPKKEILGQFPRGAVARELGVDAAYLGNILNGNTPASIPMEKKINALADQVEAEQAKLKEKKPAKQRSAS
jgi:transcriptional regulator with XRE-family HTH domain